MRRWHELLIVSAAALAVLLAELWVEPPYTNLPVADSQAYFNIALHLHEHGTYSHDPNLDEEHPRPGRYFPPLYPAMLALMMKLDPRFAHAVHCSLHYQYKKVQPAMKDYDPAFNEPDNCHMNTDIAFAAYTLCALVLLVASYYTALLLSGSRLCAGLTLLFMLFMPAGGFHTDRNFFYPVFIKEYLTDMLYLTFYALAMLCAIYGITRASWKGWGLAGTFLALTALTKPQYVYLYYLGLGVAAFLALPALRRCHWKLRGQDWTKRARFRQGAAFAACFALVMAPWLIRNCIQFGNPALTDSYAALILSQRIGYNDMNAHEYAWSFLYWLPRIGPALTAHFTDNESLMRLTDWGTPDAFARYGIEHIYAPALKEAHRHRLPPEAYYLRYRILPDLPKHLAVMAPLLWRGILFDAYITPVLLLVFIGMLAYAFRVRWRAYLLYALPPLFMWALHAFASLNVVRYNAICYSPMAFAAAFALTKLAERWRIRRAHG